MAKVYSIKCGDLGGECDFETRGDDVDSVIAQCAEHARGEHGMKSFGPEMYAKMRACLKVIEEGSSAQPG
jgi:predicted small metal-binding protein